MQRTHFIVCLAVTLLATREGVAQGVVAQRNLSVSTAKVIAEGALAECASRGFRTAVVVIDRAGLLLAALRDEQAPAVTLDMARGKAYTALSFRSPTLEFQKSIANDPTREPLRDIPGILALGGGVPITVGGEVIGAVASSGSSQTTDDECARAGILKAESLLK